MNAPLLRVDRVSREFGSGRTLVRAVADASFATEPGEVTLIMGPSGSGKTTLLSMIGGILRPTSGRIVIDGVDITSLRQRELPRVRRELVGFVFQTFNLLESLSAVENVEIALNIAGVTGPAARDRAHALLREAGLEQRLHFNARALSAGERQRVALARALANEPRLLLADEPTANLDSEAGRDVMALLRGLTESKGHAAVIVSHDPRLREVADRVLRLADGRLTPAESDDRVGSSLDVESATPTTRPALRSPRPTAPLRRSRHAP
ncbi:MAG TPA: ABC transporter ATP-binding protein [Gaiellaceae bacterium]|nr:ABC transporter ATP-binding protein [Gaiellaceae bacterium]